MYYECSYNYIHAYMLLWSPSQCIAKGGRLCRIFFFSLSLLGKWESYRVSFLPKIGGFSVELFIFRSTQRNNDNEKRRECCHNICARQSFKFNLSGNSLFLGEERLGAREALDPAHKSCRIALCAPRGPDPFGNCYAPDPSCLLSPVRIHCRKEDFGVSASNSLMT